ncbi:Panacea domain-containing protein [Micrococcus luteus]|uniref:Panacea domain-containing protein n=1 Tax=Micrococcus luteus TaxID=1270 RepID=UPI00382F140F
MEYVNPSRDATQAAHNLAAYIVRRFAPNGIGTLKLQKLMYYAQGWHLGFLDAPIFTDRMEAWKHGPVLPGIYQFHKTTSEVVSWPQGNPNALNGVTQALVDTVLDTYGGKSGWALREQTHDEAPWAEAWAACQEGRIQRYPITETAVKQYFSDQVRAMNHAGTGAD